MAKSLTYIKYSLTVFAYLNWYSNSNRNITGCIVFGYNSFALMNIYLFEVDQRQANYHTTDISIREKEYSISFNWRDCSSPHDYGARTVNLCSFGLNCRMLLIQSIVFVDGHQSHCFMTGSDILRKQVVFGLGFGHFYRLQLLNYFLSRIHQHGLFRTLDPFWVG